MAAEARRCVFVEHCSSSCVEFMFNPLNAELNPICHLLALLGGATIVVVSRLRVKDISTVLPGSLRRCLVGYE